MFFVLSGFLIGSILIKQFPDNGFPKFKTLLHFWKRRWFRTLPAYYLVLLLNILFIEWDLIGSDINAFNYKFLFFLQNFNEPFIGFFWESWSLSVEEWFYIFFPLLFFLTRIFLSNKISFLVSILALIVAPLIYRISISHIVVDDFHWDILYRKTVLCRLDAIIFGVLAAWIKFYYPNFFKKCAWICLICGIIGSWLIMNNYSDYNSMYMKTYFFSLLPFIMMLFLPAADLLKKGKGFVRNAITHISLISYSMYLIHLSLIAFVILHGNMPETLVEKYTWFFSYWIVTISVSALLYKYFEKPITELRGNKN